MLVVLLCVIINRVDSKSDARELRVKNDPYVFEFFFFATTNACFRKRRTTNTGRGRIVGIDVLA